MTPTNGVVTLDRNKSREVSQGRWVGVIRDHLVIQRLGTTVVF